MLSLLGSGMMERSHQTLILSRTIVVVLSHTHTHTQALLSPTRKLTYYKVKVYCMNYFQAFTCCYPRNPFDAQYINFQLLSPTETSQPCLITMFSKNYETPPYRRLLFRRGRKHLRGRESGIGSGGEQRVAKIK